MDKKETIKINKKPSRTQIAALGILGFMLAYTGASTDDARDAATPEQREHIAPVAVTMTMEGIAAVCFFAASLMLRKRQNQR